MLNPVWQRMLHSCTHVGVKGLKRQRLSLVRSSSRPLCTSCVITSRSAVNAFLRQVGLCRGNTLGGVLLADDWR